MASRRKGRILAFQALYAWDVSHLTLSDLLDFTWIEADKRERLGEDGIAFPRLIIAGTTDHIVEIDNIIKKHLTNWEIDRLNKVDLAILRMSVYSLLFQKDLHPSIIIDEAIDISKEFGSDESFRFVNAVLDSIRKELDGSAKP
jgi:transcription antitermination protein NusB